MNKIGDNPNDVFDELDSASREVIQLYSDIFTNVGQSATDGAILGALYVVNNGEGATQSELVSLLDVNQSTISRSLNFLVQVGRVRKTRVSGSREFKYVNAGGVADVSLLGLNSLYETTREIERKLRAIVGKYDDVSWTVKWANDNLSEYEQVSEILLDAVNNIRKLSEK